jgi:hypothetical protein
MPGHRSLADKHMTPARQAAERDGAFAAIRRLYCEALPLWRICGRGHCRRHRHCCGDAAVCLSGGWPQMPPHVQEQAYQAVMAGGAQRLPPATHTEEQLRRFPPSNFVR